ncbi:hypothetical protein, partial [Staphylococcus aureus]|uniref:hypothetical protein n=1 Tax=Staphylococcus aureus TaxID=1280 RepID=UPI0038B410D8
ENATKPVSSRTATLEVDTVSAQKLALAGQLGVISLALRNVADQVVGTRPTVLPRQLSATNFVIPAKRGPNPVSSLPRLPLPQLAGGLSRPSVVLR